MSRWKYVLLTLSFVSGIAITNCFAEPGVAPINAESIRTDQVLGIRTHSCGHVIHLLMQTRILRQSGQVGFGGAMYNPHLGAMSKPGDLQLLSVSLISDAGEGAGPIYQIQLQNCSEIPVGDFRVSVVGACGQIQPFSPTAIVTVPRIEAGAVLELQIQLPLTCLAIPNPAGVAVEFNTLIVAIDSFDELIECNEVNNVLILNRGEIAPLAGEETTVVDESIETTTPPAVDTVPVVEGGITAPAAPTSPMDSIDLDDLELGEAEQTAVRIR
ncbi:hypothetical protein [Blastopirellula marina]|uniref:CARDB domain-containing protein n=1 Tax=Blastopirellula marina DSM 3645 TaxID=314230 RepID=A3ZWG3_9BACT|nr:hypothetical protein [Blastopirellula marina]EAQ79191.1 hypothetical protein DSM3645_26249 [Blastopirellula marina DSM 3645]